MLNIPHGVSSTSLIHLERNRYSVPTAHAHRIVSIHVYPATITIVADGEIVARHARTFERDQTHYDREGRNATGSTTLTLSIESLAHCAMARRLRRCQSHFDYCRRRSSIGLAVIG